MPICWSSTMPINSKLVTYIGFSVKSRNILYGYENIIATRKKIYIILVDEGIGESSRKKVNSYAEKKRIPIYFLQKESLSQLCGGRNVKCVALTDAGLAAGAQNELNNIGGNN